MRIRNPQLSVLVLAFGISYPALAVQDLRPLTDAVDPRYNHLHTLEAQFTETYSGSRRMTRTESGTLLLKKPGRMRWDYTEPRPKMFLADGRPRGSTFPARIRRGECR